MNDARILIGVCGGIAAYKVAALTSTLVQRGAAVDVVMTPEAERFVGPLTFSSLTARPVYTSLWDAPERIPHIRLVREAQVMLIAPATANVIAKVAHGIADDLVTAAALAARIPIVIAPAMNAAMYEDAATQTNLRALRERGYEFVDPERGFLAERESGIGRLASEESLLEALTRVLRRTQSLAGVRVLVTAGPTREAFDPIRFVSNASTGSTGIAIAREAAARGADVALLLGPTLLEPPPGVSTYRFNTAQELLDLALEHGARVDLVVASAAVSDWRPQTRADSKLKKTDDDLTVRLVRNPDVLAAIAQRNDEAFFVGFAAETDEHETNARAKLEGKGLDAIVVNDVRGERGFGTGENTLTLLWKDGRKELGTANKAELAMRLLDAIEALRR
ncbi:MAG TPA: bifunctional phosphopantothenoylcysteine decarboxylase/phosphopantothenate--cysteine ligase CoaBC [Candidatus Baltobacteraceae bacterium]|nr:bifunctional phosphopantothenoylcysteine decarboxylase/phosphopantothenate--cysteine ligase CoaBC [Candidatus Baltobacteraceae bacterium]